MLWELRVVQQSKQSSLLHCTNKVLYIGGVLQGVALKTNHSVMNAEPLLHLPLTRECKFSKQHIHRPPTWEQKFQKLQTWPHRCMPNMIAHMLCLWSASMLHGAWTTYCLQSSRHLSQFCAHGVGVGFHLKQSASWFAALARLVWVHSVVICRHQSQRSDESVWGQ